MHHKTMMETDKSKANKTQTKENKLYEGKSNSILHKTKSKVHPEQVKNKNGREEIENAAQHTNG